MSIAVKHDASRIASGPAIEGLGTVSNAVEAAIPILFETQSESKYILYELSKRLIDIVVSIIVLAVLAVPLMIIGALIKLYDGGPILFSHANPYEYSDWSYVSKPEQWVPAAQNLRDNGFSIGVFGHSHRSFAVIVDADGRAEKVETDVWLKPAAGEVLLLNPGTVGQPRGTGFTYLTIQLDGSQVKVSLPNIDFDRAKFCREIAATDLSKATKDKLVSFMEK